LKYLRSTTLGCKDIGLRKSKFEAKTQFHCSKNKFLRPEDLVSFRSCFIMNICWGSVVGAYSGINPGGLTFLTFQGWLNKHLCKGAQSSTPPLPHVYTPDLSRGINSLCLNSQNLFLWKILFVWQSFKLSVCQRFEN